MKQGNEFEDIEAEPLLIRLSRQSLCLAPNQRRTRAFPLWAAAIGIISRYASLHLHLFGENKDLLEHRTDGTDAFDTLYIGCEKFPQHDLYPIAVGGVR